MNIKMKKNFYSFFIQITYDKYNLKWVLFLMFNNSIKTKNFYYNWKCNCKCIQTINIYSRYKILK
jgi:hypothetical protein